MKPASEVPTALVLVDIQRGFKHPTLWGTDRSTPAFETNVRTILQAARGYNKKHPATTILIIHVHHHSLSSSSALHPSFKIPGSNEEAVLAMEYANPIYSEPVLVKHVNSGFVGTDLEDRLRSFGARQLVTFGLTTDHCVSTTVRMAANLQVLGGDGGPDGSGEGNNGVILVRDATATYAKGDFDAETVHAVHLGSLDGEFCQVRTAAEVIEAVFK